MFLRFHHRREYEDDFGYRRWHRWLRHKHLPFALWESASEHRAKRGDVKFIVLAALSEKPMHGYDIMRSLEQSHAGRYRPSPGSVYPTLQMLEDGGFVTSEQVDGKRVYTITDSGRELLAQRSAEASDNPDEDESATEWHSTRDSAIKFLAAAKQGITHEDARVREQVRSIIDEARKKIYKVLADETS